MQGVSQVEAQALVIARYQAVHIREALLMSGCHEGGLLQQPASAGAEAFAVAELTAPSKRARKVAD